MSEQIPFLSPNLGARLDEFRGLKAGWLDGKGIPPSQRGLDWFQKGFEAHYPEHLPLPYVYPTAEGDIRAEWSLSGYEISFEVTLRLHRGEWHALHLTTDVEEFLTLDLGKRDDWAWFAARIKEIAEIEEPYRQTP